MASLTGELWDLCGSNSTDVRSGTDARFPCLNKRCALRCERPFRPTLLRSSPASMRRKLIAAFVRVCLFCDSAKRTTCDVPTRSWVDRFRLRLTSSSRRQCDFDCGLKLTEETDACNK